jgi:hypothetical protein
MTPLTLLFALTLGCRTTDEPVPETDADGDGFGVTVDCDDQNEDTYPGAPEFCDGMDQDCDGIADNEPVDGTTWYGDADGDGYGSDTFTSASCDGPPSGFVDNADDCDDLAAISFPGAEEACDDVDNDCDGVVDEELDGEAYFADTDGDGYGDPDNAEVFCSAPSGWVDDFTDCDDASADTSPGAEEICGDGIDNNCDGTGAGCGLEGALATGDAKASFHGASPGDLFGSPVRAVGDLNANGLVEIGIGARGVDTNGEDSGAIYLYGTPIVRGTYSALDADAVLLGEREGDQAFSVVGAGDVNGDGVGDVFASAKRNDDGGDDAGKLYLMMGPFAGTHELADAAASWTGVGAGDQAGLTAVGDLNGDGHTDVMVAAQKNDNGGPNAGAVFIVNGPFGAWMGDQSLYASDGRLRGKYGSQAGGGLSFVGDIDGDGVGDLLIGAPTEDYSGQEDAGAAYLVLGPITGASDLSDRADVKLVAEAAGDQVGWGLSKGGDLDGDGLDDYLVNAQRHDSGQDNENEGAVYVVTEAWTDATEDVNLADAYMKFQGVNADDKLASVSAGGDLDGDGHIDLVLGTRFYDGGGLDAGATWVVYGPLSGGTVALDVAAGARIDGKNDGDGLGAPGAMAGDHNGDGYDELVVGARWNDDAGDDAGAAYLFAGSGL